MASQANWRWCSKCQGLFFAGNGSLGACPAGGQHEDPAISGSGDYNLPYGGIVGQQQENWRWCSKCQGLFFAGNGSLGACPAGGQHEDPAISGSGDYSLPYL